MDKLKNFLEYGFLTQAYSCRRNLNIWKIVAKHIDELKQQNEATQKLFSFIQLSAQDNFLLGIARMYDKPNKWNDTRCIENFLTQIAGEQQVLDDLPGKKVLGIRIQQLKFSNDLLDSLKNDSTQRVQKFLNYYHTKYNSERIKSNLSEIRYVRSKILAHSDYESEPVNIKIEIIEEMILFVEELALTFNALFVGGTYIEQHADLSANFMLAALRKYGIE